MSVGLTLGKFAPLHRGHQLLIERALLENEKVIVMIYDCPEITPIPLQIRAKWIRELYPQVEVLEAWDGPQEVGDSPEIMRQHEDYLLQMLAGRKVDAFYSSEFYGDHVSRALGAEDRQVDVGRIAFPVSGTAVREDPYAHRHFVDPLVYRDLIVKVLFLGAPSTGKTTLADRMAEELSTVWMPEYGREYWEAYQVERRLTQEQLVEIAEGHIEREDVLMLQADRFLFVDTDARTTRIFSRYYHQSVHPRLEDLAGKATERYDLVFLCGDDIPYRDSWDRSGEINRKWMQEQIREDLIMRGNAFIELRGDLDERVARVRQELSLMS
ncbi:AAA family ATPase [Haloferula rosea]|uniref:AAA family ATPase n=1 Tax=Haloferula rosea TaxID=490093 RepID=A0A934R8V7_9BACT|nr:AAA family ATPase [Haloferula rosea]MBK1826103.1 AAA family ATPase [Haloferula rosea]